MQWLRFLHHGQPAFGCRDGEQVRLHRGNLFESPEPTGETVALADIAHWLPPCVPTQIVGLWNNFRAAAQKNNWAEPAEPLYFLKSPSSALGHGQPIAAPASYDGRVAYEGELVVVIGRRARRVAEADALSHVFGYTCGNDVTARDLQRKDPQWTRAKGFDSFCPIGPWIVTGLDVSDVEVRCEVGRDPENLEVRQIGRTKDMVFDIPSLISYVSHVMTLLPGDIILTGTPAGVSRIVPGDTVSVSIQGIGELRNPVVSLD